MAVFFSDTFTDSNGTVLSSHTPETGTGWIERNNSGSNMEIQSNEVTGSGGLSDGALYTANATYPSDDYDVTAVIGVADTGDDTFHVIARYTDNNNMLALRYNEDVFALHKKVAGTWTTIANRAANVPVDGDTVGIRVSGSTAKILKNGSEIATVTGLDAVLATGVAGVAIAGGAVNRVSSDDVSQQTITSFEIDNTGALNHTIAPNDISLALTEDNATIANENDPPTVALNTPADSGTGVSTTPDLIFTGTDVDGDEIEYRLQLGTASGFDNTLADSYSASNLSTDVVLQNNTFVDKEGQTFIPSSSGNLTKIILRAKNTLSATGNLTINIYNTTGSSGSKIPTGSILASSDAYDMSTIGSSYQDIEVVFSGANQIALAGSTEYAFSVTTDNGFTSIVIGGDDTSPTHQGNGIYFETTGDSLWHTYATELCFEVYTNGLVLDKYSVTPDATFSGTGDPHPWASGVQVTYTVQAADELDNSTTYYWRVAATDPSGTNTYGAWSTTRSFTTTAGIVNHTISPNDISLALTEDLGSITQNHVIAVNDITLGLVADNAVIDQNHVIPTDDISLSLTIDATTVEQTHVIAAQDLSLALQTDNASLTQNHIIATQDASIGLTADNTAITQNHVIAVNDISLGIVADNTSITETQIIVTQDISLALTTDATTIDQNHIIVTQDISLNLSTDNTTLTQNHVIVPDDITLGLVADNTTIAQNQIINPNDLSLPLTLDATTFTQDHVLAVNDITLGLQTDNTTLAQNHVISTNDISLTLTEDNSTVQIEGDAHTVAPNDLSLTPTIDNVTVVQNHIISPNDITLGLLADNGVIEQNHVITANDVSITLTTDNTTLTQAHIIAVNDISLPLVVDATSFTQNHIIAPDDIAIGLLSDNSTLNTDTIIAPNDLSIALTTDATTLTQNHVVAVNDISFAFSLDEAFIIQQQTIAPDDIALSLTADNTTLAEADVIVKPNSLVFGSTVPRIMFDDNGNAYYRLDSNILVRL